MSITRPQGHLRWMDYARRSMQRLGFIKWTLKMCSQTSAQTLEAITRKIHAEVTRTIPIADSDAFEAYVRQQGLFRRYSASHAVAEIQDVLLADPRLPSHSGAITGELDRKGYRHAVYVEIPTWAARLKLLRKENYTLTGRGLSILVADDENETNIFCLNQSERYILLFSILDADGDFAAAFFKRLLLKGKFTRSDAGELVLETLESLRSAKSVSRSTSGEYEALRQKLDKAIASVKAQSHDGLGPRESIATPRLEPFVDCGILMKSAPDRYEYSFTEWGRAFVTRLVSASSVVDFLQQDFAKAMSIQYPDATVDSPSINDLQEAYTRLQSGLGYVDVQDLALLASSVELCKPRKRTFEVDATERLLRSAASRGDRQIRFAIGRMGGPSQVRIASAAFTNE